MAVCISAVPGSSVIAEGGELGFFPLQIDQYQIFHGIPYQHAVVIIRMIVIAVERHFDPAQQPARAVCQAYKGDLSRLNLILCCHGLGLGYGDRSVVSGHAVIKEDQPVPGPEFMADAVVLLLAVTRNRIARSNIQNPDSLLNQIPWALVAEHRDVAVIR